MFLKLFIWYWTISGLLSGGLLGYEFFIMFKNSEVMKLGEILSSVFITVIYIIFGFIAIWFLLFSDEFTDCEFRNLLKKYLEIKIINKK